MAPLAANSVPAARQGGAGTGVRKWDPRSRLRTASACDAAGGDDVVAIGEPALQGLFDRLDDAVLHLFRRMVEHHPPRVLAMAAFHLLVHALQLEELRVEAVDPHQRMLADGRLDFGLRLGARVLDLAALLDAALDEDGHHRCAYDPRLGAGRIVEEFSISAGPGQQLYRPEGGATEPAALHHAQEKLRVRGRAADAAGLFLVDVGGEHRARFL